jgi:hypothetical protein
LCQPLIGPVRRADDPLIEAVALKLERRNGGAVTAYGMLTPMNLSRAAAALGRKGGQAKVPKGFAKMTKARRSKIGKAAILARWAKQKQKEKDAENGLSHDSRGRKAPQSKGGDAC